MIGAASLYILYGWLLSIIVCTDLSKRKGFGERPGLATGILASPVSVIVWLAIPGKPGSQWSRNVKWPDILTAVAALVLFTTTIFKWFDGSNFYKGAKFYELLVPIGAAIAYAQLHGRASGQAPPKLGIVTLAASVVALIFTLVAIATPPDDKSVEPMAYFGLLAAAVMTVGAALALRIDRSRASDEPATVAEAEAMAADSRRPAGPEAV